MRVRCMGTGASEYCNGAAAARTPQSYNGRSTMRFIENVLCTDPRASSVQFGSKSGGPCVHSDYQSTMQLLKWHKDARQTVVLSARSLIRF